MLEKLGLSVFFCFVFFIESFGFFFRMLNAHSFLNDMDGY